MDWMDYEDRPMPDEEAAILSEYCAAMLDNFLLTLEREILLPEAGLTLKNWGLRCIKIYCSDRDRFCRPFGKCFFVNVFVLFCCVLLNCKRVSVLDRIFPKKDIVGNRGIFFRTGIEFLLRWCKID